MDSSDSVCRILPTATRWRTLSAYRGPLNLTWGVVAGLTQRLHIFSSSIRALPLSRISASGTRLPLGRPWAANSHEERADCAKQITGEVHVAMQEPRWNGTTIWNRYTALIGPGYCDTTESMVSSVTPSTVACATKILSKGSL